MGTVGSVQIVADSLEAGAAAATALGRFAFVDSLMSNWTSTSEVARINATAAQGTTVHPDVATVLSVALSVSAASDGAFDITVEPLVRLWGFLDGTPRVPAAAEIEALLPRIGWRHLKFDLASRHLRFMQPELRIDLGGVAKGFAVDEAFEALRALRIEHALIDLSGNMRALGHAPSRDTWVVGVRDPQDILPYFATLTLEQDAIATSGNYEQFVAQDGKRYGHILDPRSGWSSQGLLQVTVLAPTAMEADAWATALMVLGPEHAIEALRQQTQLRAILVQAEGERLSVRIDPRLQERFHLTAEAATRFSVTTY